MEPLIDKSIVLTDEVIDGLMDDWFKRDADTFVYKREHGRLHWEDSLGKGSGYSEFFLLEKSKEELIKKSYELARDMITAMNPPMKVKIHIGSGAVSYTDGKVLYVSTKMFNDKEMSTSECLDVFVGTAVHEGCHLLYTDMPVIFKYHPSKMVMDICNIIEDERIERLCGEDKPGFANFLERAKYYYFDRLHEALSKDEALFARIMSLFLAIVRYPKYLDENDVIEFGHYLIAIKKVLFPFPKTTEEVLKAAEKIFEIMKEFYKATSSERTAKRITEIREALGEGEGSGSSDSAESSDEESKSGSSKKSSGKDKKSEEDSEKDSKSSRKSKDSSDKDDADDEAGDDKSSSKSEEGEEESEGTSKSDKDSEESEETGSDSDELSEEEKEELRKELEALEHTDVDEEFERELSEVTAELEETLSKPRTALGGKDISEAVKDKDELLSKVCEGVFELGEGKEVYFTKAPANPTLYEASAKRVKMYAPAIAKILKCHCRDYKLIHRSMRSGVLDTDKLAEAYQGVPTVYIREGEVKTDRISVCVLIDESGSMAGTRIATAKDAAILINEAIGNIPNVDLFIYGHSGDQITDYSTDLYIYREKGYQNKTALGSVQARCQNRDGVAIYEVARRVRKQTDNPVLYFILSDGAPCAGRYSGESAIRHTKAMVEKTEKLGFYVVQVCINHCYEPETMFKHYTILEDMSRLAPELGRVIKQATLMTTQHRIS